mgnify:CR=1 FL=1
MKHDELIAEFLKSETNPDCGFSLPNGFDLSTIQTLLPPVACFPKLFIKLYNSFSFDEFDSTPLTFLGNNDFNEGEEIVDYFENNLSFIRECCDLGYLPFARHETGSYDPICFDLGSKNLSDGDCKIVRLDHEHILQFNNAIIIENIAISLYDFMKSKVDS